MFAGLGAQLREARAAIVGWSLAIASAIIGLAWLSAAAVEALRTALGPGWGPAIVGAALLIPLVAAAVAASLEKRKAAQQPPQALAGQATESQLSLVSRAAEQLVEKSPLAALALAALAGILAVRFPAALTLLIQIIQRDRTEA